MSYLNNLKDATNYTYTENGAVTHKTTRSDLLDMFAFGGAYRNRSDFDCVNLFKNAFAESQVNAIKCLFYLRDCRGGQGERRFFRICYHWLCMEHPNYARILLPLIPEYGRWDDLYYCTWNTKIFDNALELIKNQLVLDMQCKTPSLLGKWVKSENTSSKKSCEMAHATRKYLGLTHKDYRQMLSKLRAKINVVETLMSANRWDEIEFDKIPSKAGLIYKNAFARRDIIKEKYKAFATSKETKVNASTLYPYEVVKEARNLGKGSFYYSHFNSYNFDVIQEDTNRAMINKYWDNLTDYFNGCSFNALCVCDTSGSMTGYGKNVAPIDVAISLSLYCAERAGGPFANHYISFASRPQLIRTDGIDFVDKVHNIYKTNLVDNTNIEGVFDLLLDTAIKNKVSQEDLPQNIIIISDMEFDAAAYDSGWGYGYRTHFKSFDKDNAETLLEGISRKWQGCGYQMPHLIFWNVDARQNNIPMIGNGHISYVSGFSPVIFQTIMSGKTGYDLMMEKLNSERYNLINKAMLDSAQEDYAAGVLHDHVF